MLNLFCNKYFKQQRLVILVTNLRNLGYICKIVYEKRILESLLKNSFQTLFKMNIFSNIFFMYFLQYFLRNFRDNIYSNIAFTFIYPIFNLFLFLQYLHYNIFLIICSPIFKNIYKKKSFY